MKNSLVKNLFILCFVFYNSSKIFSDEIKKITSDSTPETYNIDFKIPMFLGNQFRRYYGKGPVPKTLTVIWKKYLGCGKTMVRKKIRTMCGTGWPGQAILVEENGQLNVLFGSMNYYLYKVNAKTGETIWKHKFNDVIKGTCFLYINPTAKTSEEKGITFCGSRRSFNDTQKENRNFRAISLLTGKELWSLNFPKTESYSRDVESNGLVIDNILYIPAENGYLYVIDPDIEKTEKKSWYKKPKILYNLKLYTDKDVQKHKRNLVIESSPSLLNNILYITAGSGHLYGVDIKENKIVYDYYIGSDIDASPVITKDGHILVGIEKQYIETDAGVYKFDPSKNGEDSVCWFFPVKDSQFAEWSGGVIGSVSINDEYNPENEYPSLCAFCSLDGNLYVLNYDDGKLVFKKHIGPSISTPIFVDNYIIVCGYYGNVQIFEINYTKVEDGSIQNIVFNKNGLPYKIEINELTSIKLGGSIESTPIVWEGKIYIGCRDGFFYCLGENVDNEPQK